MYLIVKSLLSGIAIIFTMIVLIQILFTNILLGFMLIVSLFLMIMSDVFIMFKITDSDLKPLLEPTPKGKELMELQLLDGRTRFFNTVKGPQGKRSFRINGHDATVINDGKAQFRLPNGNMGFRAHELFDQNVDPFRCKAIEKSKCDTIKDLYYRYKQNKKQKSVEW